MTKKGPKLKIDSKILKYCFGCIYVKQNKNIINQLLAKFGFVEDMAVYYLHSLIF